MLMMKRLSAVILCILIAFSCVSAAAAEDVSDEYADTAADIYEEYADTEADYYEEYGGDEEDCEDADELPETSAAETIKVKVPAEKDPASTVLGDMDSDYRATIDDAYYLRLHYAGIITLSSETMARSDADLDGSMSLVDASYIQAAIAEREGCYYVGMDITRAKKAKAENDETARQKKILDEIDNFTRSRGVDISAHNGSVDMKKLKSQGYDFVMIRLGWGTDEISQDDAMFEKNVKNAEAAGLDWGAYIYSYALNVSAAESEVQHTLRLLKGKKPTMPIAFDWEEDEYKESKGYPTDSGLRNICRAYLSGIKAAGYYPMLYTGYDLLKGALNSPSIIDTYDIWYAQWSSTCDYKDRPLGMWQYGGDVNFIDSPYITGLSGEFDKNYAYKNYPMIIKAYGYNNHTALLSGGLAATSAQPDYKPVKGGEKLPAGCDGVMGDSLRRKKSH